MRYCSICCCPGHGGDSGLGLKMPIRAAAPPREQAVSARLHQILPASYLNSHDSNRVTTDDGAQYTLDHRPLTQRELEHYASSLSAHSNSPQHLEDVQDYFNTNSPPVLNLSPNLSPAADVAQRNSPVYDLRDSTRRRGYQGIGVLYIKYCRYMHYNGMTLLSPVKGGYCFRFVCLSV